MICRSALSKGSKLALGRQGARGFAAAASPKASYEPTTIAGVKVASRDDNGPTTRIAIVAKAGTRYEPLPGLTVGLEEFAFKNTQKRSALRIARETELLGGQLTSYHTREALVLQASFLREHLPYFTELLAEVISQTRYTTHEFHEEIEHLIQLKQSKISNSAVALDAAHAVAFHKGLGAPLYPTPSTPIASYLNENSVAAFADAAYSKANIAVVADGASHHGLQKWIEPFFKSVPPEGRANLDTTASKYRGGEQRIAKTGSNAYVIAFPGASLGASQPETAVLTGLLGGESNIKWSPGFSLLSKAAASAPGASAKASNYAYSDAGLLAIEISGHAAAVKKAAEESVKALKAVAEGGVEKEALVKAIAKAKFTLLSGSEVAGVGLVHAGANLIHGGSPLKVAETLKALESVTADKLKAAAKTLLEGKASVAAVGDLHVLPFAEDLGLKLLYNRYLAVAARVVRRSLKEEKRLIAERRGQQELKFSKWSNGKQGDAKNLADANAAAAVESAQAEFVGLSLTSQQQYQHQQQQYLGYHNQQGQYVGQHQNQPYPGYQHDLQPSPFDPSQPAPPPPPPQMVANEGIVAFDITSKFRTAASALEPGELVKDGYFTLFEAVGALEIMDPKMDSGCLAPEESLDEDYNVARPLLPVEVMGIIDQLLSLEMAWYLGYPLSQTILTNVYVEGILRPSPETPEEADFIRDGSDAWTRDPMHRILRAYCLALLKSCWYVNDRIKYEHYYEEEDFVTNTCNRSMLDNIDRYYIRDEVGRARSLLHGLRHEIPPEVVQALDFRLELRFAFLRAIELSELRSNPDSLNLPWIQMKAVWEAIYKSHSLGTPVPEAFSTKIQRRLASTMPPRPIVQLSFEETHQHFQRLFKDGIKVLDVLKYSDSQSLLNFVMSFQAQKPQPQVYIRTLLQSFLFKDMIILGHLSIRHVLDDDLSLVVLPHSRLLDPMNDLVENPHHPNYAIAHQMELFRQRAAQSYLDILRAFCQNRCRIRRTLCHSIQDWETVQVDAEEIDHLLQFQIEEQPLRYTPLGSLPGTQVDPTFSLPLSSWAYLYKLRMMEWIVQLGFELEVYAPDELAGMYWYLSNLAGQRAHLIHRIGFFTRHRHNKELERLAEAQAYQRNHASSSSVASASGSAVAPPLPAPAPPPPPPPRPSVLGVAEEAQFIRSFKYLEHIGLDAHVNKEFAEALSRFYTVLLRKKLIKPPPRPYSSDELRYDIRMKPFMAIGLPTLPTYPDFAASVERKRYPDLLLLDTAETILSGAKDAIKKMARMNEKDSYTVHCHEPFVASLNNALKSANELGAAIAAVKKAIEEDTLEDGGIKVEVRKAEEGVHDWWVIPKVTVRGKEGDKKGGEKDKK
ncbi:putative mak10 subunit [Podospora australis]|uniref:Cytochrome b-c1 complex subunit 2, mitochondrial n=1 Tax=Podospora australis TaxID=1536484 RepID=A0AAN6WSZ9_9PEZI|nr:putative mak10 subunit [Podospora australis]